MKTETIFRWWRAERWGQMKGEECWIPFHIYVRYKKANATGFKNRWAQWFRWRRPNVHGSIVLSENSNDPLLHSTVSILPFLPPSRTASKNVAHRDRSLPYVWILHLLSATNENPKKELPCGVSFSSSLHCARPFPSLLWLYGNAAKRKTNAYKPKRNRQASALATKFHVPILCHVQ